ncbi:MAG: hypothetical protein M3Q71_16800, partial [Chloroflexota bacterium]|nr:hypothetical protein [Chloroflexota bacterium]
VSGATSPQPAGPLFAVSSLRARLLPGTLAGAAPVRGCPHGVPNGYCGLEGCPVSLPVAAVAGS